jgi:hypothetical protein
VRQKEGKNIKKYEAKEGYFPLTIGKNQKETETKNR